MDANQNKQEYSKAYWAWGAVASFYLFQYILRVTPGVMHLELREEFSLTAQQFSTLTAFYLYAYSLLQIPLGVIIDRIGVRRTMLTSIILCLIGSSLFELAEDFWMAQLGRFLIGAGSASAFMGGLKLAADHFPPGKRGFFIGATLTLGTIGALVAGKPLVLLMEATHWRTAVLVSTGLGIVILGFAYKFIPQYKNDIPHEDNFSWFNVLKDVVAMIKNWRVLVFGVLAIGLYTPLSVTADSWGTAFFMEKFGFNNAQAAQMAMMMYLGLAIGCLVMPGYLEKKGMVNLGIRFCLLFLLGLFSIVLYVPSLSPWLLTLIMLAIGFFCGAEMLCFTGAVSGATPYNSGLIIGIVNTFNMLGAALMQQLIGYALDEQWDGSMTESGIRYYDTQQFVVAFSLLIGVIFVCAIMSFKMSKTKQI